MVRDAKVTAVKAVEDRERGGGYAVVEWGAGEAMANAMMQSGIE